MAEICDRCQAKFKANDTQIKCSGICCNIFHPRCVDIQNKDLQVVINNDNIKWFCNKCTLLFNHGGNLMKLIDDFKKDVNTQLKEFRDILLLHKPDDRINKYSDNNIKKTYSEVAGEVIVIKPKSAQDSKVTKDDIQKNIKPATLEVGITQMKNTKEGGVLIKCNNKDEIQKIKVAAEKKLNKNYKISIPEQKNPCIKILDLEENMEGSDLISCMLKQNSFLDRETAKFEVKTFKKMKTRYMSIVECDPASFKQIMEYGKLSVGWSVCRVFEYVRVYRCYKCGGYDHKADECKKVKKCLKCNKTDHGTEDCDGMEICCGNCIESNEKLNLNLPVDHCVFDMCCPVLQRKIETEKRKIKVASDPQ